MADSSVQPSQPFQPSGPAAQTTGRASLGGVGVLLAAALWGTSGTVLAFAPAGASPVSVSAARIALGGLLLLALGVWTVGGGGLRRLLSGHRRRALFGAGSLCVVLYQTAFFVSVDRVGVATGTIVTIGSAPVFAGLLGRSRPSRRWLLATAGAVTGCAALIGAGHEAGAEPVGLALALTAGLMYAGYATVAGHFIGGGADERAVAGLLFGGAALMLLPVLLAGSPGWLLTGSGVLVAGYLGAVTTTVGYVLYMGGLRTTPVAVATTLTLAEPAVAAVLGVVVLGERLNGGAAAGLGLLVLSLLILLLPARAARR